MQDAISIEDFITGRMADSNFRRTAPSKKRGPTLPRSKVKKEQKLIEEGERQEVSDAAYRLMRALESGSNRPIHHPESTLRSVKEKGWVYETTYDNVQLLGFTQDGYQVYLIEEKFRRKKEKR